MEFKFSRIKFWGPKPKPPAETPERELAQARRCQLLTGSHNMTDHPFACDCEGPSMCHLSKNQRDRLKEHPAVQETNDNNLEKWVDSQ